MLIGMLWQMKAVTDEELLKAIDHFENKYKITVNEIEWNAPISSLKEVNGVKFTTNKAIQNNCLLIGNSNVLVIERKVKE